MRYRYDLRGTREDVLHSAGVAKLVHDRAEDGAEAARARAPVETGAYQDSITVRARSRLGDRHGAILTATVPYAQRIEQKYHVIASVVDLIERG